MMKKSVSESFKTNRLLAGAGILLITVSLCALVSIGLDYKKEEDVYGQLQASVLQKGTSESTDADSFAEDNGGMKNQIEDADTGEIFDYRALQIDFDALKQVNTDITGWILFDNNGISYPILQGKDNEEYLYTLADKTENKAGSIFLDASCAPDLSDSHTIIYGHNMKNLSMFGKLKNYRIKENYYEENRYFTIYTPENILRYEIFAWYEVGEDDSVYQVGFAADEEFGRFVEQMIERRYQDTGVSAEKKDKIVTLSTCSAAGRRFVVHGKLIASDVP